ncbi:MAG: hypothetical protein LBS62_11635 [Clostridiales bacterium]|jgi:hypothetical protein|nr:hypothetical protein [Clostridiales bacterium]
MYCVNHNDRTAVNTCSKCGAWLCSECSLEIDNRYVCKNCVAEAMRASESYGPAGPRRPEIPVTEGGRRHFSWGLLFLFSVFGPPGISYMYLGLIKRGLFVLSAFFAAAFLTATFSEPILGFVIAIIYFGAIFDSFNKRRLLNAGINVPDSVEDYLGFIKRYAIPIIIVIGIVIGLNALNGVGYFLNRAFRDGYGTFYYSRHSGISFGLALLVGLFLLIKFLRKRSSKPRDFDTGGQRK